METLDLPAIRRFLSFPDVISRMRDALISYSRNECETPMPIHLDVAPVSGEVHIKSSYRRGGRYFVLKVASTFPGIVGLGLPSGNGMMLLISAETGEPAVLLSDSGHLTDVRTAAVTAMVVRELKRRDRVLGILGSGIQARLQAQMSAHVLDLETVWIWGRTPARAAQCRDEIQALLPRTEVRVAATPAMVARESRLIVTCTASRQPLLETGDLQPGTFVCAVGSDSPGKQELHAGVLRCAGLLLVDSLRQCEKLGELQHASSERDRAVEIGAFCERPRPSDGVVVCDCTGLGIEDLFIAEYCYERSRH